MSVWYCIPSARPPAEAEKCLSKWRERGYKIALWLDEPDGSGWLLNGEAGGGESLRFDPGRGPGGSGLICVGKYPGYAKSVNRLVKQVLAFDSDCDWVVTGGDDVWPDPNRTADEIAAQCSENFAQQWIGKWCGPEPVGYSIALGDNPGWWTTEHGHKHRTFGVMQPTGDRWGENDAGAKQRWPTCPAQIDRICGSPWMGREFCERINQGSGPLWHEYPHSWVDEELQNVAIKHGCFWQRRDLTHYHDHCCRGGGPWAPHLQHVSADYARMKPLFDARKRMAFPGSEPL